MFKTALVKTKKYLKKISKDIKKFRKKKPKIFLSISLGILLLILSFSLYIYLKPKPNDDIFFLNTNNEAILGNKNPSFNVNFGKRDEPDTQWVRFEAKSSSKNPFKEENENIFTKISNLVKPKKEYGIEMSLEGVKLSETEKLEIADSNEVVKSVAEIIGTDDISTTTELVESGRIIGEYTEDPVSKKTVLNKEVAEGVDIEYQILEGLGLKEEIVIRDLEAYTKDCGENLSECKLPLNEFVFDIRLDKGLQLKRDWVTLKGKSTESYHFEDADGNYVAHFLPSWAIDSAGDKTYDVILNVEEKEDGNYRATVIVDINWLFSSDRVYPVRIDPSIVHDSSEDFNLGEVLNRIDILTGPKVQIKENVLKADANTVGLWHLEETGGTGAYLLDSSGNNNHGTPTGTTYTEGKIGGARSFNGTSDIIVTAALATSPNAETLELWIKPSAKGTIVAECDNTSCSSYVYTKLGINANGTLIGHLWNLSGTLTFGTLTYGQWYHIAMTYDGTTLKGYLNGNYIGSKTGSRTAPSTLFEAFGRGNAQCSGGFDSCTTYYSGVIDEIRYSNTARTPEEIQQSYYKQAYRYGTYVSEVLDLGTSSSIDSFDWTETGVGTGDGETPFSTTGLIGQWDFNETSGTTADNVGSCGASCDGTLTNFSNTTGQDVVAGSGWTSDNRRWGEGALMFDGTDDYVALSDSSLVDFDTGDFTLEVWVNSIMVQNDYYPTIISKDGGTTRYGYDLVLMGSTSSGIDSPYFEIRSEGAGINVVSGVNIRDGLWHHLVAVKTSTQISIYVDGELKGSVNHSFGTLSNPYNLTFGAYAGSPANHKFDGRIDAAHIYSRALPSTEILSNYQAGNIEFQYRTSDDGSTWGDWYGGIEESVEDFNNEYLYDTDDSGLVAYYPMDEDSGISIEDVTTNTNNGTASGTVIVDGKHDNARYFDGIDDYIDISNSTNFDVSSLTIEAWVKSDNFNRNMFIFEKGTVNSQYSLFFEGTSICFRTYNSSGVLDNFYVANSTLGLETNGWNHIVATYDRSFKRIYVNGILKDSKVYTQTLMTGQSAQRIGAYGGSSPAYYFNGSIDEVSIYSQALSSTEIHNKWLEGSTNPSIVRTESISNSIEGDNALSIESNGSSIDGNTVGYWKLDESSGTGAYIKDSSPNGNNGTPTGTTYVKDGKVGGARNFNGSSDYVTIPVSTTLNVGDVMTISAWIKPTDTSRQTIYSHGSNATGGFQFEINGSGGAGSFGTMINGYYIAYTGGGLLEVGEWNHIVYTRTGAGANTHTLYLNGVAQTLAVNATNSYTSQTANSLIGGRTTNAQIFNGVIDEIKISNVARTPEEILESYTLGKDKYISESIDTVDLSSNTTLPFWIASDEIGSNIDLMYGESEYANYEPDENTVGLWHLDGYGYKDSSGNNNDGITSYYDVEYGIQNSNLTFVANQWNGSANDGEIDITCPGGDSECYIVSHDGETLSTPSINYGVAMQETTAVQAFIMYSPSLSVQGITPLANNSNNFVGVRYNSGWQYDNNGSWVGFTPTAQNILIASLTTGNPSVSNLRLLDYPGRTEGNLGDARSFNGSSDYIIVPDNDVLDPTEITLEAWIKPSVYQTGNFINKGGNSGYRIRVLPDGYIQLLDRGATNILTSKSTVSLNEWSYIAATGDPSGLKIYINGVLDNSNSTAYGGPNTSSDLVFGRYDTSEYYSGKLDEVRISNIARTPDEIRQAYEVGKRTHPIKIDFKASLQSSNLITGVGDTSFTISEQDYGTTDHIENLNKYDKIIIKENYDGTEYIAQGEIDTVNTSTGAVTVSSWDSGSTFPTSGFTTNATVFKWQREYIDVRSSLDEDIDNISRLTFRKTTDVPSTFWIDDVKKATYMEDGNIGNTEEQVLGFNDDTTNRDSILKMEGDRSLSLSNTEVYSKNTFTSNDITGYDKLPFWIASDQKGYHSSLLLDGSTDYANYIPDANTVGYWKMDEESGTGAYIEDFSSNSNDGTPSGTTFVKDGKVGGARSFNGTSDYINLGNDSSLNLTSEYTMEAWVKLTSNCGSGSGGLIISKGHYGSTTGGYDWGCITDGSGYTNRMYIINQASLGQDIYRSNRSMSINEWHHLATVYDNNQSHLYLDGLEVSGVFDSGSTMRDAGVNTNNVFIGNQNIQTTLGFPGTIDEVRISNRARTPEEIYESYNIGKRMLQPEIKFKADLQSSNLITNSGDTSFDISETAYDTTNDIENLENGDKIIITEDTYKAQGTVDTVNTSTGAVTVSTWDSGSTFPLGGYTTSANVFKWQKEYLYTSQVDEEYLTSLDQITMITSGQANIWYDDIRAGEELAYLDSSQYFQYRAVFTTTDEDITPWLSQVNIDYTPGPTMDQIMRHGKWFGSGQKQNFWWARTE